MKTLIIFLMMCGVCWGANVERQNIKPKTTYKSSGNTFFMVNMTCAEENTVLPNVKNNTFVKSIIKNCILDGSNTFERSLYGPEEPEVIVEDTYEELEDRIIQLETFITDEGLTVPSKTLELISE